MTITRRDALRLAAAAAGTAAPFAVSAEDARAILAAPLVSPTPLRPGVPAGGTWDAAPAVYDPAEFVRDAVDGRDWPDVLDHIAAEGLAHYRQARAALFEAVPALRGAGYGHPIHDLDAAVHGIAGDAYLEGLRAGAAAEHLRLATLGSVRLCRRCQGIGVLWGDEVDDERPSPQEAATCPSCGGRGTVATPAPTLEACAAD